MNINRRMLLGLSGYALAGGLASVKLATAQEMKALHLVTSLGKPSITWATLDLLRPALQQELKGEVVVETIAGHDGLDALHQVLEAVPDEPRLLGTALLATQYAWGVIKAEAHLEDLTPIAKVTNGFSLTLFAKRGGALKNWADIGAAAKPLKVSSLQRHTAAYLALLMAERKGGLAPDVTFRETIGEVIDDVTAGRSALGIANTTLVLMELGELQPIVSFGAQRNALLGGHADLRRGDGQSQACLHREYRGAGLAQARAGSGGRAYPGLPRGRPGCRRAGPGGGREHTAGDERARGSGRDDEAQRSRAGSHPRLGRADRPGKWVCGIIVPHR